jgi:hypothetical protein
VNHRYHPLMLWGRFKRRGKPAVQGVPA